MHSVFITLVSVILGLAGHTWRLTIARQALAVAMTETVGGR